MRFVDEILAICVAQCIVAVVVLFSVREIRGGEHSRKRGRFVRRVGWKGRSRRHIILSRYYKSFTHKSNQT
jgi:hypothetical protein